MVNIGTTLRYAYLIFWLIVIFNNVFFPAIYQGINDPKIISSYLTTVALLAAIFAVIIYFFNVKLSIILIVLAIFAAIGSIAISWYLSGKILNNIKSKFNSEPLMSIRTQFGRTTEDFLRDHLITRSIKYEVFPEFWHHVMNKESRYMIFTDYNKCAKDEILNLYWYMSINPFPRKSGLSDDEVQYLYNCNVNQLKDIIGQNNLKRFDMLQDRASLIFTIMSQQYVPSLKQFKTNEFTERLARISNYPTSLIYNLTFPNNLAYNDELKKVSKYPPNYLLACLKPSTLESILLDIIPEQYDLVIEKYQLGHIDKNVDYTNLEQVHKYILKNLSSYHKVLEREEIDEPPNLNDINTTNISNATNILLQYTNLELIEYYDPIREYNDRYSLIKAILDDYNLGPVWSTNTKYCNNLDTVNILTGETHGEMLEEMIEEIATDITDPIVSFGTHKNYACYSCSELEASFREYNGRFMFHVPDWVTPELRNKEIFDQLDERTQNYRNLREFSLDEVKQLRKLLDTLNSTDIVNDLISKIDSGLKLFKSAQFAILQFTQQYNNFTTNQKSLVNLYLCWLFTYAMWMRFWNGPGHEWSTYRINVQLNAWLKYDDRASPEMRDEHIFIQNSVRTKILEMLEQDSQVYNLVSQLPIIYYDFFSKDATAGTYTVFDKHDSVIVKNECMGFASDLFLKSGYYYIMELAQVKDFNIFINENIQTLNTLEYQVVTNALRGVNRDTKLVALNKRLDELNRIRSKENFVQPSFNSQNYQNNVHVG